MLTGMLLSTSPRSDIIIGAYNRSWWEFYATLFMKGLGRRGKPLINTDQDTSAWRGCRERGYLPTREGLGDW